MRKSNSDTLNKDSFFSDLEALSTFLGDKQFLMGGDGPSEADCVLFGFVSCILLGTYDGCPFKVAIEEKYQNLQDHMLRMKELFFPDWEELIRC